MLAFEPALTELLARRRAECIPEVLSIDGPRMLTADAGRSVRELVEDGAPVPSWEQVVALYADVQLELVGLVDELLALGVPDSRPETLGHDLARPVPLTLIHEEIHDGNVHVSDGRPVFIDWAEASVSHPFAGMTNTLRMVSWRAGWEPGGPEVLRLRDAYLEPWTRDAPIEELRELFAEAYAFGALVRATTWERVVAPLSGEEHEEYAGNADAWREIYREALAPDARLGA